MGKTRESKTPSRPLTGGPFASGLDGSAAPNTLVKVQPADIAHKGSLHWQDTLLTVEMKKRYGVDRLQQEFNTDVVEQLLRTLTAGNAGMVVRNTRVDGESSSLTTVVEQVEVVQRDAWGHEIPLGVKPVNTRQTNVSRLNGSETHTLMVTRNHFPDIGKIEVKPGNASEPKEIRGVDGKTAYSVQLRPMLEVSLVQVVADNLSQGSNLITVRGRTTAPQLQRAAEQYQTLVTQVEHALADPAKLRVDEVLFAEKRNGQSNRRLFGVANARSFHMIVPSNSPIDLDQHAVQLAALAYHEDGSGRPIVTPQSFIALVSEADTVAKIIEQFGVKLVTKKGEFVPNQNGPQQWIASDCTTPDGTVYRVFTPQNWR